MPIGKSSSRKQRLHDHLPEDSARTSVIAWAGRQPPHDWERIVGFFAFPKQHWKHLRTTPGIESPFAAVRLRTGAAQRHEKVENATAVIRKVLMVVEKVFRRLDAPELLAEVLAGLSDVNGVPVRRSARKVTA